MEVKAAPPGNWPYRAAGRRLRAAGHDWWLVDCGPHDAPVILLLHGLGASGHSFRRTIAGLSVAFRVVVPDLPGQGFSRAGHRGRLGLAPMAEDLATLCQVADIAPVAIVGHSAGAALALQMARYMPLRGVVGLNAALGSFEGAEGLLFPVLAQGLAALPFTAPMIARLWGTARTVDRLLQGTGSALDPETRALYLTLVRNPAHVAGALGMMAQWRLSDLMASLPGLQTPVLLIATTGDRAVPARISREAAALLPQATFVELAGGHLAHEEAADGLSRLMIDWLAPRLQRADRDGASKIA